MEKGMLSEGGMREPWIAHWKDHIPAGQVYAQPVISLDVAATALALAGLPHEAALDIPGPVTVTLRLCAGQGGAGTLAWRTTEQKDFTAGNTASFDWPAGPDWREVKVDLPVKGRLIHLRIRPPTGGAEFFVQSATLAPAEGKPVVFDFTKASNSP
jgi:hypothetical protein